MSFLIWFNFPPFAFPLVENIYSFLDILFTFLVFDFPLVASCFCCFSFFGFHLLCSPLYFIPFHVLFPFILSYFLSFFYFLPFPHLLVSRLIVLLDLSFSMLSFPFTFLCAAIFPNARQTPPKKKTDLSRFKWSHGALLDLVSSRGASWAFMVFHVNSCELMGPHESRRDVFLAEKTKQESPDQKWTPNWKTLRLYNHQCKRDIAWSFPTVQNKVTNLTSEILKAIQPGLYNARPHRCIQWKLKAYPARADNWNQISSPNLTSVRTCSWGAFLLRLLLKHV